MGTFAAVLPVFLIIALGLLLRRTLFRGTGFWLDVDRLVYWCLFPALLFRATATIEFGEGTPLRLGLAVLLPIAAVTLALLLLRRPLAMAPPRFAGFVQTCIRQNTYIAFAASQALWGEAALQPLALAMAFYVPGANVISTLLLLWYGERRSGAAAIGLDLLRNPLILACLLGIAYALTGLPLPATLDGLLAILASASLPLALLAVGAGLGVAMHLKDARDHGLALGLKLLALPALTLLLARLLGVEGLARDCIVLMAALPTAASAYIQTRQMGGDAAFVGAAISLQTAATLLTLPFVLGLLLGL